jgi:hypothetical protein
MPIDQATIGIVAAELMEELAEAYGEDAVIERVALIVAIERGEETMVHYKFSVGTSVYVAKGLLAHVQDNVGK